MSDVLIFSVAFTDTLISLFLAAYFVITLSDLECDYLNASSCCSKLNKAVLPEIFAQLLTIVFLLYNLHIWLIILNLPIFLFLANKYLNVPPGSIGIFDPTEIHNRRQLQSHMKEAIGKLVYHCLFFIVYLYCLISSIFFVSTETGR